MTHDHSSGHAHDHTAGANARQLTIALALTGTFLIVEVIGGLLFNSLALLSDAAHMFTDAAALAIALLAITPRPLNSGLVLSTRCSSSSLQLAALNAESKSFFIRGNPISHHYQTSQRLRRRSRHFRHGYHQLADAPFHPT